eukprot:253592-Amphidinium_carterae.1
MPSNYAPNHVPLVLRGTARISTIGFIQWGSHSAPQKYTRTSISVLELFSPQLNCTLKLFRNSLQACNGHCY